MAETSVIGPDLIHSFLSIRYIWKAQSERQSGLVAAGKKYRKNVNKTLFLLFFYLFILIKICINNFHKNIY